MTQDDKKLKVTGDPRRFSDDFIGKITRPAWLTNLFALAETIKDEEKKAAAFDAIKYGKYSQLRAIFHELGLSEKDIPAF